MDELLGASIPSRDLWMRWAKLSIHDEKPVNPDAVQGRRGGAEPGRHVG
jgi:hypothetical protein